MTEEPTDKELLEKFEAECEEWKEYDKALQTLYELIDNKGRCEGCKEAVELLGKKEDDYIWIRAEENGIHFCLDEREGE